MTKISAAILTYNRKNLLQKCLEAVCAQTRACDAIVVVDNGSTDGTAEMVRMRWGARVQFHRLSRNIGASGGFSAAMRIGYQQGADFVWLMDDDVIPAPDALAELVQAEDSLAGIKQPRSFLLSTVWTEDGQVTNVPKVDTRHNRNGYENWPILLEHKLIPVTRGTFASILLPRETIARCGLPLAQMFMWGEDSEFTMRATRTAPGYAVGGSKVLHLRTTVGNISILTETNPARIQNHRHLVRNQMYTMRTYAGKLDFLQHAFRHLQNVGRLLRTGQFAKARIVASGFVESFWFFPKIEAAESPVENLGVSVALAADAIVAPAPLVTPDRTFAPVQNPVTG